MNPFPEPYEVTLVHSAACRFCDDAQDALRELALDHPIHLTVVPIDTPQGRALVAAHRPAMNPLVLVDGVFFSAGRFPRRKFLRMLLAGRAAAGPAAAAAPSPRRAPLAWSVPGR